MRQSEKFLSWGNSRFIMSSLKGSNIVEANDSFEILMMKKLILFSSTLNDHMGLLKSYVSWLN